MYVYASTKNILDNALKRLEVNDKYCEIPILEGEILEISTDGYISKSVFEIKEKYQSFFHSYHWYSEEYEESEESLLTEYGVNNLDDIGCFVVLDSSENQMFKVSDFSLLALTIANSKSSDCFDNALSPLSIRRISLRISLKSLYSLP